MGQLNAVIGTSRATLGSRRFPLLAAAPCVGLAFPGPPCCRLPTRLPFGALPPLNYNTLSESYLQVHRLLYETSLPIYMKSSRTEASAGRLVPF